MELSDLDRLEQSVKRTFERVERLEKERDALATENGELKKRLSTLPPAPTASRLPQVQPSVTPDQLAQIKQRISRLIDRIGEMERNL